MAYDLQEQEQIAELKAWWGKWGKLILTSAAAGIFTFGGVQAWNYYNSQQSIGASLYLSDMEKILAEKNPTKIIALADKAIAEYPKNAYTARVVFLAAKAAHDNGDVLASKRLLMWIADNASEDILLPIAKLRLAAILADEKKYDAALDQVKTFSDDGYAGLFLDAKGDILTAKEDFPAAKTAYKEAIAKLGKDSPNVRFVELKLSALETKN
ncbi:YfgM family protein [Parachitinimonas caeni]|uniref:Ancillary SecYEG translocon subunit n=1 Tax=Parachitinimonas caeni TaxID=3031301 RepID=A0ABT7DTA1_9NEIS|nr:tetratricopeptide repeat protein [Parachitinimonas caeni]MDK2123316.1 tetratricopeptide repeat protein [Parachitinimonas caeni]